ncbi:unnamed protein product [Prunus armeniaca]
METKQKHNRLSKLGKEMGFPYDYYVDPVGLLEVYALEEKYDWWELIHQAIGANGLPWLCIGDHNEILWAFKKKEGPDFTWSGRRGDGFVVQERLDRALIDVAW